MRMLITLLALAGALPGPSVAAPVGGVSLDVYDPQARQLVRYVSSRARSSFGLGGVPGLLAAPLAATEEAAWAPPASRINRPGRSPLDVDRLASGGDNLQVVGMWRALCLLVDFSDHPPQWHGGVAGATHYRDLLFSQGTFLTGSLYDYCREVSYTRFTIGGTVAGGVAGWYRAPSPYATYTNNASGLGAYPNNAQKLVEELVDLANPDVNYADYDNDRDGYVDALFIVHSGPASQTVAAAQRPNHISNHKWEIAGRRRDGRVISVYCMQAENARLGAFAHEFGHVLGLPDLYDTDGSSRGAGRWSLMASGDKLGNPSESRPGHPDAWCKYRLGWLSPTVVQGTKTGVVIPPVETSATAYALWKDGTPGRQFFLVENRQRTGFDGDLPGAGLCIWHVDESKFARENTQEWWPGKPTGDGQHYLVAIEQADGAWHLEHRTNPGDAGDPFPGTSNRRVFDGASTPNSDSYGAGATGVRVSNISNPNAQLQITADLEAGTPTVAAPDKVVISPDAPSPDDDLTATATGTVPPGATGEFAWWVSIDGGQTYTRKIGADSDRLSKAETEPWQMWQARVRVKSGTTYSNWTSSWPATILPGVDPLGNPVGTTWFAHQHARPPGLTDPEWNAHYYNSDGLSWGTAFHYLPNATAKVQSGDMILFGPGDHPGGSPFTGVSLAGTAPQVPEVRTATRVGSVGVTGVCSAAGLTLTLESSGETLVQDCGGEIEWAPSVDALLNVRGFEGKLRVTGPPPDKNAEIDVAKSSFTQFTVDGNPSGGVRIRATESQFTGEARVSLQPQAPAAASATFTDNTISQGWLAVGLGAGSAVIADNTVKEGRIDCSGGGARRVLRNKVTGKAPEVSRRAGISCYGCRPALVSGNEVTGASGPGLELGCGDAANPAEVTGNTLSKNEQGGMWVSGGYLNVHDNRITDNTSLGDVWPVGGGICISGNDHITVTHNVISGNKAASGGGVCIIGWYDATIRDNEITGNTATKEGGGLSVGSNGPLIEGNLIERNKAADGGGVYLSGGASVRANRILANQATASGGGVYLGYVGRYGPFHSVTNNVIARNRADLGGGVCFGDGGNPYASIATLDGNTLDRNRATHGGGIYASNHATPVEPCRAVVKNSLVTESAAGGGLEQGPGVTLQLSYSNVLNNAGGNYVGLPSQKGLNGNLSVPPRYVDATGDYHLQSQAGHWDSAGKAWVKDEATSLCIDAGDPTSPYAEEREPNGDRVNMGAYGNTPEASKSFVSMMTDHFPDSGDTGVPLTAAIRIVFRWNLYQDTVRPRFSLTPAGGSKVAGTFQWPVAGQNMVFRPSAPLQPNTKYTVELARGIRRVSGGVIDWSESFSFTTGAATAGAPEVTACATSTAAGTAAITLRLSAAASVSVSILNLAGRIVATLPPRDLPSGLNTVLWDGRSAAGTSVPAGRYVVNVTARAPDGAQSRALTVLNLAP